MGEEKKAGAELKKKKKDLLGQKLGEKIEYKGQKITNFQKKKKKIRDFLGQRKTCLG